MTANRNEVTKDHESPPSEDNEDSGTTRRRFLGSAAALSALGVPEDVDTETVTETVEAAANKPMASLEDDEVSAVGGSAVMEDHRLANTSVKVHHTKLNDGREVKPVANIELGFPYGVFSMTVDAEEARRIAFELLAAVEEGD